MPEPELSRPVQEPLAIRAGGTAEQTSRVEGAPEQRPTIAPEADRTDMNEGDLAELWGQLRAVIRKNIQPEQFETWFRRAGLAKVSGDALCLAVQNGFSRDWIRSYYLAVLEEAAQKVFGRRMRIDFVVDPELLAEVAPAAPQAPQETPAPEVEEPRPSGLSERLPPDSQVNPLARGRDIGLNPRYTFDNFVVGPCNRFCHAVSLGTAESPGKAYNPLFLHGNVGLGKTHLLQAICFTLIQNWKDVRILYLSCETFVNHFIGALENGDLAKFRNKYRNVDVLVVDDIHLLANKERTQEEFFHTFNTLYNAGKQIILSSDSPPKDIPTLQERLVSRFKWGLVTEIEPPCYETRMAILKRKGRERGNELPEEVAQLIAERVNTNIRELEGSVNKLYSFANVTGQPITVAFAREVLPEIFQQRRGAPSMEDIIEVVTGHFGVRLSDLQSKKRTNQIAYPRQVAMYLARRITRHSLEEIGGFFGGRDHSTVLHAVRKIEGQIESDEAARAVLASLLERLQGPPL
jgi:chromosomal replication initiator protein